MRLSKQTVLQFDMQFIGFELLSNFFSNIFWIKNKLNDESWPCDVGFLLSVVYFYSIY